MKLRQIFKYLSNARITAKKHCCSHHITCLTQSNSWLTSSFFSPISSFFFQYITLSAISAAQCFLLSNSIRATVYHALVISKFNQYQIEKKVEGFSRNPNLSPSLSFSLRVVHALHKCEFTPKPTVLFHFSRKILLVKLERHPTSRKQHNNIGTLFPFQQCNTRILCSENIVVKKGNKKK